MALYAPALFFSIWDLTVGIFVTVPVRAAWGWNYITKPGPIKIVGSIWVFGCTIAPAAHTWRHYLKSIGWRRRQVLVLALASTVAAVTSLSTGYMFSIFAIPAPSLTITAFIIGAAFILYATWRYELFALTPQRAATEIVDNMSDLLFLTKPDGKLIMANRAAELVTGYRTPDISKMEIGQLLSAGGGSGNVGPLSMQGVRDMRMNLTTRGGQKVPVSVSVSPIEERGRLPGGFVYLARDITEREHMQKALHLSEQNFRTSVEESPVGVSIIRDDSVSIYGNQALLDMFLYKDRHDFMAQQPPDFYTPESYEQYQERRRKRLRGEPVEPHFEVSFRRRDGQLRYAEVFQKEVLWDGEQRLMLLYVDVTEQRQAENALKEREEQYRRLSEELKRQNDQKTHFLHQVAHELKTPLTAIISSSELVTTEDTDSIPKADRQQLLDNINRSAWMMNTKVSELLDLARIQTGQVEFTFEAVDVGAVIRDIISQLSSLFSNKQQPLEVCVPQDLPKVRADRVRTEEVVVNLLSNANKFTAARGSIRIGASVQEGFVRVEVKDMAPAIERLERERIFEPYYRGGSLQDRQRMPGLGLGLAISKSLIELQHGRIGVDSEEGHGNNFFFTLPVWKEDGNQ